MLTVTTVTCRPVPWRVPTQYHMLCVTADKAASPQFVTQPVSVTTEITATHATHSTDIHMTARTFLLLLFVGIFQHWEVLEARFINICCS